MQHFTDCVGRDEQPLVTGEDGRAVLEVVRAAYHSAGTGRVVELPFSPPFKNPIDRWLGRTG